MTARAYRSMHPPGLQSIAVFRALQLGDMLCAVPALRALRGAYPAARITLIGLPWARSFVDRYAHLLDELVIFPGAIGFPEQVETDARLPEFGEAMRKRRFDLAIQLHGSGTVTNDIVLAMGARRNAGFFQPGASPHTGAFIPWPDRSPEPARYTALMRALGIAARDLRLEIPLFATDIRERDEFLNGRGIHCERLVLVHPGAQLPSRRWPVERFAQVARALVDEGWQVALTGSEGERALTACIAAAVGPCATDLAGRTSLGGLAALVRVARLVVCNDTSVSHVAAAMRTPSVVVACGSDTRRWAPLDRERHRVLADYPLCRPCAFRECPYGHPCALNLGISPVLDAVRAQLNAYAPTRVRPSPDLCSVPSHATH
jgi:ADP-heptose:LPS heptosyltransferase